MRNYKRSPGDGSIENFWSQAKRHLRKYSRLSSSAVVRLQSHLCVAPSA